VHPRPLHAGEVRDRARELALERAVIFHLLGELALTEALLVEQDGVRINFTLSIGVAVLADDATLDQWVARADAALYRAKQAGRNRVAVA